MTPGAHYLGNGRTRFRLWAVIARWLMGEQSAIGFLSGKHLFARVRGAIVDGRLASRCTVAFLVRAA